MSVAFAFAFDSAAFRAPAQHAANLSGGMLRWRAEGCAVEGEGDGN